MLALKQRLARFATALALEVASATTVGLNPTRTVNEDSCGYVTWATSTADGLVYRALLCVADGMGGMEAGEVASRAALRSVLSPTILPPGPSVVDDEPPSVETLPRVDPVALVRRAAPVVHAARRRGATVGRRAPWPPCTAMS